MRRKFIAAIAALLLALGAGSALAQSSGRPGVVIQVSDADPKTWNQALNVIGNVQAEYGKDKVDIEVVVFGNGVGLLQFDSPLANRVEDTLGRGAKVLMCENTMAGRKLAKADMLPNIGYVKAGVVEIIEKHRQGWTVVRP